MSTCPRCGRDCAHLKNFEVLDPPRKPEEQIYRSIEIIASVSVFIIALTIWVARPVADLAGIVLTAYLVVLPLIVAWGIEQRIRAYKTLPRWRRSMRRYQRLYFCPDDEVVFDDYAHINLPVAMVENYLDNGY